MPNNPKVEQINAATQTAVTGAVPLGLHPDQLLPLANDLTSHEVTTPAYVSGRTAQKLIHDALKDMTDAEHATRLKFGGSLVVDGKTIQREIPEDRRAQLAADLGTRFESTAKSFDRHFGVVNEAIESLIPRVMNDDSGP